MIRRPLVALAAIAFAGLSACTAQQRHMAQQAVARKSSPAPVATTPAATVKSDAQCASLIIDFSGWPAGTTARVNVDNDPPARTPDVSNGWAVNWDTRFASPDGGYAFHVEVENSNLETLQVVDGQSPSDCPAAATYAT